MSRFLFRIENFIISFCAEKPTLLVELATLMFFTRLFYFIRKNTEKKVRIKMKIEKASKKIETRLTTENKAFEARRLHHPVYKNTYTYMYMYFRVSVSEYLLSCHTIPATQPPIPDSHHVVRANHFRGAYCTFYTG